MSALCADCSHVHGGRGYGLCYTMLAADEVCPCLVACAFVEAPPRKPVRAPPRQHIVFGARRDLTTRTLSRHAAKAYAEMATAERARYERAARRIDDTLLTLDEYAEETGLDRKLLWRMRKAMGLRPQPSPWGAAA